MGYGLNVEIRHYLELLWESLIGKNQSVEPGIKTEEKKNQSGLFD
jgi:hypothetical protein